MNRRNLILSMLLLLLAGCKTHPVPSSDYMILDEVVYIDKFPQTFTLQGGEPVDLNLAQPLSLFIQDSLLIVSTDDSDGFWSFFTLPEYKYLGKYIMRGKAGNEFIQGPWVKQQAFFRENGDLFSMIYNFQNGKTFKMNIDETLRTNNLNISQTNDSLTKYLFGFIRIDSTTFMCKERERDSKETRNIRYILKNGEKTTSDNLEKLNLARVGKDKDFNILATHYEYNQEKERVVEASLILNQINLYSLNDSFGKTICFGKELDNISIVQQQSRENMKSTYMNLNAYSDYFGALYVNETDKNIEEKNSILPVIQFFDWDGNPLAEVKFDRFITTIEIDFLNGNLYTLNYRTEEIYKYDFREVLNSLQKNKLP